jgi:hypothetical protein
MGVVDDEFLEPLLVQLMKLNSIFSTKNTTYGTITAMQ